MAQTQITVTRGISEAEQNRVRSMSYEDLHAEVSECQERTAQILQAGTVPDNVHDVDFDRAAASGEFGDKATGSDLRQELVNRKDFTNYAEAVLQQKADVEAARLASSRRLPDVRQSVPDVGSGGVPAMQAHPSQALSYLLEADGGTQGDAVDEVIKAMAGGGNGKVKLPNVNPAHIKAIIETGTTTGVSVDRPRTGPVELLADPDRTVAELLPVYSTFPGSDSYTFPREAAKDNTTGMVTENDSTGAPEQLVATTNETVTVQRVAAHVQVTREQLQYVQVARAFIDARLSENMRQRTEKQVVNGNGTAPNMTGLLNQTGIANQAARTQSTTTLITHMLTAITKLRKESHVSPNVLVVNFDDMSTLMSTYTENKELVWGSAVSGAANMLWGIPIMTSAEMPANTAMALRTSDFFMVTKGGLEIESGWVNDDLTKFRRTMVASYLANVGALRPKSLIKIVTTAA